MNTRNEVEAYLKSLGIEMKSEIVDRESTEYGSEVIRTERYMPITGEKIIEDNLKRDQMKVLNDDAQKALLDLISQSITSGDMETAKIALEVLQEESGFYKGHRNAAIDKNIPLDKRLEFEQYCQPRNESKQFTGPMAAFMAAAQNVASERRTETVNRTTSEIKDATIERDNSDREH